jgi:TonB family protein
MRKIILLLFTIVPILLFGQARHNSDTLVSDLGRNPTYNGGLQRVYQYLAMHLKYPDSAKDNNITGTVYITFVIEANRKTHGYKVLKGLYPCLDREALRVVESIPEDWVPRIIGRDTVASNYTLPIKFMLH